ncbi:MAG TPA: ABC transporter permease [Acidimicrobiales bacterium]|jgi:phospholipid/cholesterol/gamma-HCH transport system permease protein|nr:ABC transporter permease [Acidimicrobiales bacterium]
MAIDTPVRSESEEQPPSSGVVSTVGRSALGSGNAVLGIFDDFYTQLKFYVKILKALPRALRYPREILVLMSDITLGSGALIVGGGMFFVVTSIAFFTGTEVGLEGFNGLQQIGAEAFTGVITALANTREITPLVAGVALAAQVGAGFTAQLGAMRISDEIDALEVMGVNSVVYLVATRVWAALITMIPLYLAALFASYLASELVVTKFFGLSPGTYQHYFRLYLPPIDILYSFLKAMIFAVLVTFVHCYYGYNATGGPAGVGVAAGRAIRLSIILVVVVNLFMSLILFGGVNASARLVG